MKPHIIIQTNTPKTSKKLRYEVFHIAESKDVLGNEIFVKQSVGTTEIRNMEAEIKEYELQIEYRKQVIEEIKNVIKNKLKISDVNKKLEEFIKDRDEERKKDAEKAKASK